MLWRKIICSCCKKWVCKNFCLSFSILSLSIVIPCTFKIFGDVTFLLFTAWLTGKTNSCCSQKNYGLFHTFFSGKARKFVSNIYALINLRLISGYLHAKSDSFIWETDVLKCFFDEQILLNLNAWLYGSEVLMHRGWVEWYCRYCWLPVGLMQRFLCSAPSLKVTYGTER